MSETKQGVAKFDHAPQPPQGFYFDIDDQGCSKMLPLYLHIEFDAGVFNERKEASSKCLCP